MVEKTLIPTEKYLKIGCHIGTKFKSGDMKRYIFKNRKDGLKVLDIETIDERIRLAVELLSRFDPKTIAVVSRRLYGKTPVLKFAELVGAKAFTGRFVPGTFTNPNGKEFFEPKILIVSEPESDDQAIVEAERVRIPVIGLCSTNNELRGIDLVVPINNKGRKSLALFYCLAARELMKKKEIISKDEDFKFEIEDFEYQLKEGSENTSDGREQRDEQYEENGERRQRRSFQRRPRTR